MGMRGPKVDKIWSDALRLAALRIDEEDPQGRSYLHKAAEACVTAAAEGKMDAIKEIGDRLDGKPHQSSDNRTTIEAGDTLTSLLARIADQRNLITKRDDAGT